MAHILSSDEFSKKPSFYNRLSEEVIKKNISDCYNTLLKVKDYKNILKPMSNDICYMNLNWSSNKLRLVNNNLEVVKQFINDEISMEQLFDKGDSSVKTSLDLFQTPCKSVDEINTAFEKYNKFTSKVDAIMKIIEEDELDDSELFEITSRVMSLGRKRNYKKTD